MALDESLRSDLIQHFSSWQQEVSVKGDTWGQSQQGVTWKERMISVPVQGLRVSWHHLLCTWKNNPLSCHCCTEIIHASETAVTPDIFKARLNFNKNNLLWSMRPWHIQYAQSHFLPKVLLILKCWHIQTRVEYIICHKDQRTKA